MKKLLFVVLLSLILSGCFSTPAITVNNICHLLDEEVSWYQAAKASEKKYGVPMYVQLAIMYQESNFKSDAQPPRSRLFGFVPWTRPTSAYGFAQAVDATWEWYQQSTGNADADRGDFADSIDFMGWYINKSNKLSGISKTNAYHQYLAYHEGHGGFNRKTHNRKPWLKRVAKKVASNARRYKRQLTLCSAQLDKNSTWSFF